MMSLGFVGLHVTSMNPWTSRFYSFCSNPSQDLQAFPVVSFSFSRGRSIIHTTYFYITYYADRIRAQPSTTARYALMTNHAVDALARVVSMARLTPPVKTFDKRKTNN